MHSASRYAVALLAISLAVPPPVYGHCPECGPIGISENEPNCGLDEAGGYDDFVNGGCGAFDPRFTPIAVGQTICGTVAMNTVTGVRDTDWFELVLTEQTKFAWHFSAEFRAQVGLVQNGGVPDCADVKCYLTSSEVYPCSPVSQEMYLVAGTWWFHIAPAFDDEIGCDLRYTFQIVPLPAGDVDGDGEVNESDLKVLLHFWETGQYYNPADLDYDGTIGILDLLLLLEYWLV